MNLREGNVLSLYTKQITCFNWVHGKFVKLFNHFGIGKHKQAYESKCAGW